MVVKSDGTKWACQSCLKGHRVSGCTHTDRELILVPKKGRPVTQCQHCRQERKKRSAHVKCDCGEIEKPHHSKEKCIHLREADERLKAGLHEDQAEAKDPSHLTAVAEEQGCCCHHGGKCTCAVLKKEDGYDDTPGAPHGPAVKPRLEPTKSEGSITVFQNGHHKPVHRKNYAAHESGMPYKVPMPRSHTDSAIAHAARRSVESLALDNNMPLNPSDFTPQTSAPFNAERRLSKSEEPCPKLDRFYEGRSLMGDSKLPAIDFSGLAPYQTSQSFPSAEDGSFAFPIIEPMSGVDSSFDPWSALPSSDTNSLPNNNPFGVWPTGHDVGAAAQPALTAASSGTQSEIDEMPPMDFGMPSIQEDTSNFNFDDFFGQGSPQANRRSLPPNFLSSVFKSSDRMTPGLDDGDLQFAKVTGNMNNGKPKQHSNQQSMIFQNAWLMHHDKTVSSIPSSDFGTPPVSGRPSSHSIGHTSAPNDEIMQQLFPGIDINGNSFAQNGSSQVSSNGYNDHHMISTNATSSPVDFGSADEGVGFTSQPWSDGSMSVPNDAFTSPFDLNQEFSDPDFTAHWMQ